ncbi:hypothetical protein [Asaia sp. As-1742]|uniref:hypothetical protein n=1 Tax=Asaia sp. As-1742 TaxID=2608325 RepID=UPI0014238B16|nr:hypothetical protein [Asaia sp. As-1742]NIE81547.1 hypothetical protein [Asaia sp. As-1742]
MGQRRVERQKELLGIDIRRGELASRPGRADQMLAGQHVLQGGVIVPARQAGIGGAQEAWRST